MTVGSNAIHLLQNDPSVSAAHFVQSPNVFDGPAHRKTRLFDQSLLQSVLRLGWDFGFELCDVFARLKILNRTALHLFHSDAGWINCGLLGERVSGVANISDACLVGNN